MGGLERKGLLKRVRGKPKGTANWQVTPLGRARAMELADDMDLAALAAEAARRSVTLLADTPHPVIPPSLAPPELIAPLRAFFNEHPFALNVFGMTRFPGKAEDGELDPIAPALDVARDVCKSHGLEFHLASDRQIVDDLWANVAAHLWGSQYAIAFFEDRTGKGLNYNLNRPSLMNRPAGRSRFLGSRSRSSATASQRICRGAAASRDEQRHGAARGGCSGGAVTVAGRPTIVR